MNRHATLTLLALGGLALTAAPAAAQVYNPYAAINAYNPPSYRPYATGPLSPYLNIFAGGRNGPNANLNNAAINYYNLARPVLDAQNPLYNYNTGGSLQQQFAAATLQP